MCSSDLMLQAISGGEAATSGAQPTGEHATAGHNHEVTVNLTTESIAKGDGSNGYKTVVTDVSASTNKLEDDPVVLKVGIIRAL